MKLYNLKDHNEQVSFAQAVTEIGALASGISGSGPTLFALCDKPDTAQRVADWLSKNYLQNQEGFVHICRLDTAGARVLG